MNVMDILRFGTNGTGEGMLNFPLIGEFLLMNTLEKDEEYGCIFPSFVIFFDIKKLEFLQ